jgi:putative PEP-CTERM system histidine kinase
MNASISAASSYVGSASYGLGAVAWLTTLAILAVGGRNASKGGLLLVFACAINALWALWLALQQAGVVPSLLGTSLTIEPVRSLIWAFVLIRLMRDGLSKRSLGGLRAFQIALALVCAALLVVPQRLTWSSINPGHIQTAVIIGYLTLAVVGIWLAEILFRNTPPDQRWRIKFFCFGLGGLFAYDFVLYVDALLFRELEPTLWQARGAANAVVAPLVAVAAVRNRELALDAHLSRRMVYHGASLTLVGIYLLFVAAAGYYLRASGSEMGVILWNVFLFGALLALAVLVFSGQMRARLRVLISKHFFSYRYDYREQWLALTQRLSRSRDLHDARESALQALASIVESPGGQLWLREGPVFRPLARWNMPAIEASESLRSSLCRFLASTGWVIKLADYRSSASHYPDLELPAWLEQLSQAWLIVPLTEQDDLLGFAVLAKPRARIVVDWEVCDILKTASSQVTSHLSQLASAARLAEANQFAGFHRLSAFVLHDLKNLVAQQSLVVARAGRHRHNPDFVDDMVGIFEHSVGKMQRLMDLLKSGVSETRPSRLELALLVGEAVQNRSAAVPAPRLEVDASPLHVYADHDRLLSVLEHLIQNAQDATSNNGGVRVALRRLDGQAWITVADDGCGMDERFVQEHLFRPFYTTKGDSGMGIGAYESREYARALGGEIDVDSTPGVGTRITLRLPMVGSGTASSEAI